MVILMVQSSGNAAAAARAQQGSRILIVGSARAHVLIGYECGDEDRQNDQESSEDERRSGDDVSNEIVGTVAN
jgi:hypothetical protein